MKNILINIYQWFMCFLRGDTSCPYSLKKLLAVLSFGIVAYLAIWTEKDLYLLLSFICILLGISSWEKKNVPPTNPV